MPNVALKSYTGIFDARGGNYDSAMERWPDARRQEFGNLLALARVRAGEKVCDFPAGGGYMARYMPPGASLTLLESLKTFYDRCRQHESASVTSALTTGNAVPFPDGHFDKILSLAGIHHNTDQKGLFEECARSLKPGGAYCVADVYAGSAQDRFLDTFVNRYTRDGHEGIYLNGDTHRVISATGLHVDHARVIAYPWIFQSVNDMAEFCMRMFSLDGLSVEEAAAGIREYLGVQEAGGQVMMNWSLYFIRAIKPIR